MRYACSNFKPSVQVHMACLVCGQLWPHQCHLSSWTILFPISSHEVMEIVESY
uniref:Uncharacterized protein n=1 Tax=Arundo donax TaxID=35708 RepID=A0A0A8Y3F0_ARUDO